MFSYLLRMIASEIRNGRLSLILNREVCCMILDRIALVLTIVGALNWGSIGIFSFDIVAWICGGADALLARIICATEYSATGIAFAANALKILIFLSR